MNGSAPNALALAPGLGEAAARALREARVEPVAAAALDRLARDGEPGPDALLVRASRLDEPALARLLERRPGLALLAIEGDGDGPGPVRERPVRGAPVRPHELLSIRDLAPGRLDVRIRAAVARARLGAGVRTGGRARGTTGPARGAVAADRRGTERRVASSAELRLLDALGRATRPSLSPAAAREAIARTVLEHTGAAAVRLVGPDAPASERDELVERCLASARTCAGEGRLAVPTRGLDEPLALVVDGLDAESLAGSGRLLSRVAAQAAVLLERADLLAERRAETRRFEALLEIDRVLGTDLPLEERVRAAMTVLAEAFDAGWAMLYEADARRRETVRALQVAPAGVELDLYSFDRLEGTLAWRLALDGEPMLCGAGDRTPAEDPEVERRNRAAGVGAALIAPLRARGDRRGCLVVLRHESRGEFEPGDLDACREVADRLSMLIERAELVERVAALAGRDALTGLADRRRFETELARRCEAVARAGGRAGGVAFSLLFIDLDGFKRINDSLGHEVGDRLLEAIAARLEAIAGEADLVARLGGDEFAIVVADASDRSAPEAPPGADRAAGCAARVLEAVRAPVPVAEQRLHVGASVGIARCPDHARGASELLRAADAAMYLAKREGRGRTREWSPGLARRAARRLTVESSLRACLETDCGDLSLAFQPQIGLDARARIAGVEVFARWEDPRLGTVMPGEFIAVAEQGRLLGPLSDWLLERTCAAAARLARVCPDGAPTLSINVTASVLAGEGFVADVEAAIHRHGIAPSALGLELSESGLMHDVDVLVGRLHALRALGVRVALDDFGTGRSALRHLARLPLHALKIDRTFVAHLGEQRENDVLVRTMLELANDLELDTVAEGVETGIQLERLRSLGCDAAQGWLLARPEPLEALEARLDDRGGTREPRRAA